MSDPVQSVTVRMPINKHTPSLRCAVKGVAAQSYRPHSVVISATGVVAPAFPLPEALEPRYSAVKQGEDGPLK